MILFFIKLFNHSTALKMALQKASHCFNKHKDHLERPRQIMTEYISRNIALERYLLFQLKKKKSTLVLHSRRNNCKRKRKPLSGGSVWKTLFINVDILNLLESLQRSIFVFCLFVLLTMLLVWKNFHESELCKNYNTKSIL